GGGLGHVGGAFAQAGEAEDGAVDPRLARHERTADRRAHRDAPVADRAARADEVERLHGVERRLPFGDRQARALAHLAHALGGEAGRRLAAHPRADVAHQARGLLARDAVAVAGRVDGQRRVAEAARSSSCTTSPILAKGRAATTKITNSTATGCRFEMGERHRRRAHLCVRLAWRPDRTARVTAYRGCFRFRWPPSP